MCKISFKGNFNEEDSDDIGNQFDKAGLTKNQKITVISFDNAISSIYDEQIIFKHYEHTKTSYLSGRKEGVEIVFAIPNKKGEWYRVLSGECLIIDGWVEIPERLLWGKIPSITDLMNKENRFPPFDQWNIIFSYLHSIGVRPIINTYKPQPDEENLNENY